MVLYRVSDKVRAYRIKLGLPLEKTKVVIAALD